MSNPEISRLFARVCRDAGFLMDGVRVAVLVGKMLNVSPLQVWIAVGSLDTMDRLANGSHPYFAQPIPTGGDHG